MRDPAVRGPELCLSVVERAVVSPGEPAHPEVVQRSTWYASRRRTLSVPRRQVLAFRRGPGGSGEVEIVTPKRISPKVRLSGDVDHHWTRKFGRYEHRAGGTPI